MCVAKQTESEAVPTMHHYLLLPQRKRRERECKKKRGVNIRGEVIKRVKLFQRWRERKREDGGRKMTWRETQLKLRRVGD